MSVKYFLGRERFGINTPTSTDVLLNDNIKGPEEGNPLYGTDRIKRSDSEIHLGEDKNREATVDVAAKQEYRPEEEQCMY